MELQRGVRLFVSAGDGRGARRDPDTGDPRAVWGDPKQDRASWAAHDPTELAPRLAKTLARGR
jgi:hypothetical protein